MAKNFRNNRRNTRGPRRTPRSPESKFEHILTLVAGVIFGGLTLLFLMYLVGIRDKPIECSNAPLVALIFGLCVGLSATFIGGYASAKGNFAFPIVGNNPLAVAASGGIAALLLTSLLAHGLRQGIWPRSAKRWISYGTNRTNNNLRSRSNGSSSER